MDVALEWNSLLKLKVKTMFSNVIIVQKHWNQWIETNELKPMNETNWILPTKIFYVMKSFSYVCLISDMMKCSQMNEYMRHWMWYFEEIVAHAKKLNEKVRKRFHYVKSFCKANEKYIIYIQNINYMLKWNKLVLEIHNINIIYW